MRCEPMENCTGKTHRKGSLWTNYRSPRNRVRRAKLLDCVFLFGLKCLGRQFSCWHPGLIPHWHLVATRIMTHIWRQSKTDLLIDIATICHSAAFKELQCFQTTNSLFSYHGSTSEERKQLLYQGAYMLAGSLIVTLAFVLQCIRSNTSDECHRFQVPATLEWALLLIWHLRLQVADLLKYTDYLKVIWNWQSNPNYTSLMKSERGGEEAEKEASSLEFQCYISLSKHTQELSGEGWRPDTLILQNPRLDGVSTASKAPGGPGAPQTVLGPRRSHGSWYHKLSGIKHRRSRERTPEP